MSLSVIICTYNGSKKIARVLQSIARQEVTGEIEIILIDNNSTDGVSEVFSNLTQYYPFKTRLIVETKQGLFFARRRGLEESIYDLVLFVDDDNYLTDNDFFQRVINSFQDSTIGAVGGTGILLPDTHLPEWFKKVQRGYAVGAQSNKKGISVVNSLYGACFSFRKKILLDVLSKGYENLTVGRSKGELASGEDSEICEIIKLSGSKLIHDERLKFYHDISPDRVSLEYTKKLYFSFGKAISQLLPLYAISNRSRVTKFVISNRSCIMTFSYIFFYMYKVLSLLFPYYKFKLELYRGILDNMPSRTEFNHKNEQIFKFFKVNQ